MAGFFDVIKGKNEGNNNNPAVEVNSAGEVSGSRPGSSSNAKASGSTKIDSPAASYARERAAAAKAQIEARKAMEQSRKAGGKEEEGEKAK